MSDVFLFAVVPYVAVVVCAGGLVYRLRFLRQTVTTRSSQLLERRWLRIGALAWHWGILPILAAHLLAAVFPGAWGRLLGAPVRLYVLEVTGLALGALTVIGMVVLIARRATLVPRGRAIDAVAMLLLLAQSVTGVWIALTLRWGSGWYVHTAAPWLLSLAKLDPQLDAMAVLPLVVKVHAVNAFVLLALVPLTRLVHAVNVPLGHLFRAPQLVVWRRPPSARPEVTR